MVKPPPPAICPSVTATAHRKGPPRSMSSDCSTRHRPCPPCPRGQQHSEAWPHCKRQACLAHLHVGRRQQWRRTERRCRAARCQRRGRLSRVCQPRHRPPRGSASAPLLRRRRHTRAQRAAARALPHEQSRPARRPRSRRRVRSGPEASPGWPEQARSSAPPRALLRIRARLLGARPPRARLRLPRWFAPAPPSGPSRPCHEVHANCSESCAIMGRASSAVSVP